MAMRHEIILHPLHAEEDLEEATSLFARCFFQDKFYKGAYPDEQSMREDFKECFAWMLENTTASTGAFCGGKLVGEMVTFPIWKLSKERFEDFFGEEGPLHDAMGMRMDCVFLFCLCVEEPFRGEGISSKLLDSVLLPDLSYVADTTGEISRGMCERRGFELSRMTSEGEDWWFKAYRPKIIDCLSPIDGGRR